MACARQQTVLWARVLQQWLPAAAGTAGPPLAAGTGVSRRAHGAQLGAIASCLHRHAQRAQQHQLFSSSSWPWQSQWRHSSTAAVANTQQLLDVSDARGWRASACARAHTLRPQTAPQLVCGLRPQVCPWLGAL
jgi:hypothetical protein